MYHSRGLRVTQLNTDNKFLCIEDSIRPVPLKVVAAEEDIEEIKRSTRKVKESTRRHVYRLSYEIHPRIMNIGCITKTIKELNNVPVENGISNMVSSCTLITGRSTLDYKQVSKVKFGDYVQAYMCNRKIPTRREE